MMFTIRANRWAVKTLSTVLYTAFHLATYELELRPLILIMIRTPLSKIALPAAKRFISNSTKVNNVVTTAQISHENPMSASSPSSGRAFKAIAYTVLGSTAVVAGLSHLFKDEVVYWTPNVRK
ncbi:hypothetical protein BGZ80_005484 [Entomortierella chlamydospora]|uniref:Uncharacterized protein n=1 Tax=Entomortierella chlamydospora TaxID=101097 RepID=A0A9P6T4K8_9FUNG|nr:hypothetical protein BGZ80_005484 [Entomortierella chlamydospora]